MSGISKELISEAIDAYENAPGVMQFTAMEAATKVFESHYDAEVARLRAELQNAAKAALDAVALSCEKEREADALRVDAMRYRWLRDVLRHDAKRWQAVVDYNQANVSAEQFSEVITAAMGADA